MPITKNNNKILGVVVPLGAIYTEQNPVIGEFPDLVPFANFCKNCGINLIQLLPVNDTGTQSSPYSGLSAFALHPIYIRINAIEGFNELYANNENFKKAYDNFISNFAYTHRYNYDGIMNTKVDLLKRIYDETSIGQTGKATEELSKWIKANHWVKTYAVYKDLKWNYMQASWKSWHENDQHKSEEDIEKLWETKAFKKEHLFYVWCQMIASKQFEEAVKEVHELGIKIKGDMPILMNEDSCDAWAYPQFFNQDLRAGSPADGDNPTGQNWGFPTYNWKNLKTDDYSWWKNRLKSASKYYDAYRLDHILGFFRIWAIPSTDCNALMGHTEPYASVKREELQKLTFDDDRIRWLSQPHIPTGVIEDITWNHEAAHKILELLCNRIGQEELWLFKKEVKGSQQIWDTDFGKLCTEDAAQRIKAALVNYWSNRTLIEISKNKFVPLWTYSKSTSWQSLNDAEKTNLLQLFDEINEKNVKLWKKQSEEILSTLTESVKMVPCGEDLGVNIECVPKVMEKQNILGLRVVRWCRNWGKEGQPYLPFDEYTPLSVTTTSVHDSSTIRQWWEDEKDSAKAFVKANPEIFGILPEMCDAQQMALEVERIAAQPFSSEIAKIIMTAAATSASKWNISPLQDYLYMNEKYWLEKAEDERINIPGTVTAFNWTYRLPVSVEELQKDQTLISEIINISKGQK